MYRDTKVYLKKYWKSLLAIFVFTAAGFLGPVFTFWGLMTGYENYFLEKMSHCSNNLAKLLSYRDGDFNMDDYNKYYLLFKYEDQIGLKTKNCNFSDVEKEYGLDIQFQSALPIFEKLDSEFLRINDLYKVYSSILYKVEYSTEGFEVNSELSTEETYAINLPKVKKYLPEEEFSKITNYSELKLAISNYYDELEKNYNKLLEDSSQSSEIVQARDSLEKVQEIYYTQNYIWIWINNTTTSTIVLFSVIAILALSLLAYLTSKISYFKKFKVSIYSFIFGNILLVIALIFLSFTQ